MNQLWINELHQIVSWVGDFYEFSIITLLLEQSLHLLLMLIDLSELFISECNKATVRAVSIWPCLSESYTLGHNRGL